MFSKLSIYQIQGLPAGAEALGQYFTRSEFTPTTPNQEKAFGWMPPRAKHGAFVEAIGGHWIAKVLIETRKVPSDAVQRRIDEIVAAIEQNEGRKPGRHERAGIRQGVVADLMPQAFPKQAAVPVWIDPARGLLLIGSTSQAQLDDVVSLLVRSLPDVRIGRLDTKTTPRVFMNSMLCAFRYGEFQAEHFETGRECELRADDESKAVIRYKNQDLARDDVLEHIQQGKQPTLLGMNHTDRVAFVLTEGLQLKKIEFLDGVFEGQGDQEEADAFDADAAIATGELSALIANLIEALGGIMEATEAEPVQPKATTRKVHEAEADPMIDRARALVIESGRASISYLQRMLQTGYNHAARLLEALEAEGVVSPMQSDGQRSVLTT